MPIIQLVIPDLDLLTAVKSELIDRYSIASSTLNELLRSAESKEAILVICHQSILHDEQTAIITKIKESTNPEIRILVIGSDCASHEQVALLKHGARGYYNSATSLEKLGEAVNCIIHGEVWVERYVISGLVEELSHQPEVNEGQRQAVASLSPKELEVAQLVSHGATNKMIASKMGITERTVKAHLTTTFHKMNLADRLSLAILFRDLRE